MKRLILLIAGCICLSSYISAFDISQLKRDKDISGRYGYVNLGDKDGWWAEAHLLGEKKEGMNMGYDRQFVISAQYEDAQKIFSENLAAVCYNGKMGFIDKYNRFIIPPVFKSFENPCGFKYGLAPVKVNNKFGYIDKSGTLVIDTIYDYAESFDDDHIAVVKIGNKYGAIDILGDSIVPCDFPLKEIMKFVPGKNRIYRAAKKFVAEQWDKDRYCARRHYLDSIANQTDRIISDSLRVIAAPWKTSLVENDSTYNLVNDRGEVFANGLKNATNVGSGYYKYGYDLMDSYGRVIARHITGEAIFYPESKCFVVYKNSTKEDISNKPYYNPSCGLIAESGMWIFPPFLSEIKDFKNGIADVRLGECHGTIDSEGYLDNDFINAVFDKSLKDNENKNFYIENLIRLVPADPMSHNNLGILYAIKYDNLKESIRHLSIAKDLAPDNEKICKNLKLVKSERNDRRWNKVLKGLEIAGTILTLGADIAATATGQTYDNSSLDLNTTEREFDFEDDSNESGKSGNTGSRSRRSAGNDMAKANKYRAYDRSYDRYESMVIDCINNPEKHSAGDKKEYQRKMRKLREDIEKLGYTRAKSPYETK